MMLWILIGLMAVVTYASRALYLFIPEDRIPRWLGRNLDLIPVVILSSMIGPALLAREPSVSGGSLTHVLAAGLTAALLALTRNAGWAVIGGVLSHLALKLVMRT